MAEFSHVGEYDLELERVISYMKEHEIKSVCIQLPDGLKCHAHKITEEIEGATGAEVIIWAGSAYGACDLAIDAKRFQCDLLIHWGHSEWKYGSTF
ncbi:MAG: diphthamide synthesis protein [Candidatus Nanoarchaeia archaeon]